MKTSNRLTTMMVLAMLMMIGFVAHATPATDTIYAQGFMKRANNTSITDGTYTMAFGVFQNGTLIWAKQYSVTTSSGLFSQALTGLGGNLAGAALTAAGLAGDFTAVTLNPALLSGAASGAVSVRVYAVAPIDSANPTFDIPIGSVATSYVAGIAKAVEAGSITLASLASSAAVNSSSGATDSGKIPLLNGSGLLSSTFLPTTFAPSGAYTVAPAAVNTASGTGSAVSISAGNESGTTSTGGSVTIDAGTGTSTNGTIAIGSTNSSATSIGGGTVAIAGTTTASISGSSSTTVGSNTGAAATTVQSGTGGTTVSSTGTTASAVNVSVSGTNGGITLAPNGSGVVTVSGTSPTVTSAAASGLTVAAVAGQTTTVGATSGASPITLGGGSSTGAITIGNSSGAQNVSIGSSTAGVALLGATAVGGKLVVGSGGSNISKVIYCSGAGPNLGTTAANTSVGPTAITCTGATATGHAVCSQTALVTATGCSYQVAAVAAANAVNVSIRTGVTACAAGAATNFQCVVFEQ